MGTLLFKQISTFTLSLILMLPVRISYCQDEDDGYEVCSRTFDCGNLTGLSYPFWSENVVRPQLCRQEEFKLVCREGQDPIIKFEALDFFIKNVSLSTNTMTIATENFCPVMGSSNGTIMFNGTHFRYSDMEELQIISFFYGCNIFPETIPPQNTFSCPPNGEGNQSFYTNDTGSLNLDRNHQCGNIIEIPVPRGAVEDVMNGVEELRRVGREGFNVTYDYNGRCSRCQSSGGICGTTTTTGDFACHCDRDHPDPYTCFRDGDGPNVRMKVIIGSLCGGIAGIGTLVVSIVCYIRRRNNSHVFLMSFLQSEKLNDQDIESFMRNYGSLIPTRHSYADVKKITNLFKEKLGQGGFGSVYKGKLLDGRLVAVKILNETKGNGEEFINEVASISRTSHINIVSLLGFCLERHKRALVYEFMPNGSLEKYIGDESHLNTNQHLEWEKLYQIAIGVARGLEYLHRGCTTRIVHFDIKPHNILLDKDFCPKISDFGLAKLCTREKSILSMLGARGTVGYIAPEVFSRNFGGVSHKSDVYSYGMVLLDMVGEKRKDDGIASDASEKYFPYWVYKHLELNKFGDLGVTAAEDVEIVRKMTIVGLSCIQMNPSDRPSMSKVIEMLEGSIEILEIPPTPFLSSSTRSASDTCTLSLA